MLSFFYSIISVKGGDNVKRSEHEDLLTKALGTVDPQKQGELSEILQTLREDYSTVLDHDQELEKVNSELSDTNDKLTQSNSRLFLKMGQQQEQSEQEENEEDRAETITIDDLIKGGA